MKNEICAAIGIVGGAIASLLGGWDTALQTLIIFMAIDYITGLIVAGCSTPVPRPKLAPLRAGQAGRACAARV
jgi:Holin family.